jgi:redox-sensitive bicupin YhaK (pirin superfamily)
MLARAMSNLAPTTTVERCVSEPAAAPAVEALPGHLTDIGGLPIRRLLPRSRRRLVGPWCFLDSYGPATFGPRQGMDVAPHPHTGLQTVSWLLEGELLHHDSLGQDGLARPGVLNLMTAGRGIAHAEVTPQPNSGSVRGVQLWVALPALDRETAPAFDQHRELPRLDLDGGRATLITGELAGARSPARAFSPMVGADVVGEPGRRLVIPLERRFEHALVPLQGACRLGDRALEVDTLYYLGLGRSDLVVHAEDRGCRLLLLGGAPFGETILMWWNFVGRTTEEILAAREDWQAGRRFGEVRAYAGPRLAAPAFTARPVPRA